MDQTKPYYVILLILLIFIFLWFFFGGQEVEFVGLNPLNPDKILDYPDSSFHKQLPYPITQSKKQMILPSANEEDSMNGVCVDLTPQLPPEFTTTVCFHEDKPVKGGKFTSKGEKLCRETMERIFGIEFPNQRPHWLINDRTGYALEIDCLNMQLMLGIEYQGVFHTVYPNFVHKTYSEFKEQVRRDKLKVELCKKHGVHLIVVPHNVPHTLIPQYIMRHLPEIEEKRNTIDNV